jgi:putative ABC transport system permease protein
MAGAVGAAVGIACGLANVVKSIDAAAVESFSASAHGRVWVSTLEPNNSAAIDARTPPTVVRQLATIPGVGRVERSGYALSVNPGDSQFVAVHGTDRPFYPYTILRGPPARTAVRDGRVLVGPTLARLKGLRSGSKIRVASPRGFVTLTVGAVWADPDFNGTAVTMPTTTMDELFGPQPPQEIYLVPAGKSVDRLAADLRQARLDPFLQVKTPPEVGKAIAVDVRKQLAPFWALQRAMMVVAFVATLSTLLLVGVQRRRELGLLAAVGMAPGGLAGMALIEAGLVAVVGSLLGALAGAATDEGIRQTAPILFGLRPPFRFDLLAPLVYALVAVGVVSVAALLPAVRTARMPVLEAIRYE